MSRVPSGAVVDDQDVHPVGEVAIRGEIGEELVQRPAQPSGLVERGQHERDPGRGHRGSLGRAMGRLSPTATSTSATATQTSGAKPIARIDTPTAPAIRSLVRRRVTAVPACDRTTAATRTG